MLARRIVGAGGRAVRSMSGVAGSSQEGVGILAMDAYFPGRYVDQAELEAADGVGAGKYTIGLGQREMAFVSDREDVNSIMMTAVSRLLERYDIDPHSIGRLEVGTESLVDKSKSSRTTLMSLFDGNTDMEGATVINACYGGTAALFNSVAWGESSAWNPRKPYSIYVAGDVAVYDAGPARPTGGCGAVAVLVGPGAPIRLMPRARASFAEDAYDFYKPTMMSEYPEVDGKLSQVVYTRALDSCYSGFCSRQDELDGVTGFRPAAARFDYMLFHSPYNKLVQQSLRRMLFMDCVRAVQTGNALPEGCEGVREAAEACAAGGEAGAAALEASYTDRALDKAVQAIPAAQGAYEAMVKAGAEVSQRVGNTYTGALHANLLSLIDGKGADLVGKRAGAFSYGSGAIATMFGLEFPAEHDEAFSVERIASTASVGAMLDARTKATPEEFSAALLRREATYGRQFTPEHPIDEVPVGAFYLDRVDDKWHRHYARRA